MAKQLQGRDKVYQGKIVLYSSLIKIVCMAAVHILAAVSHTHSSGT